MISVHVQGGTNAGRRRPLAEKPNAWRCGCPVSRYVIGKLNPGYLAACPDCKERRP